MTKIFIVQAEHPFSGYQPMHAFSTVDLADAKAVELVNKIIPDFWEIFNDDTPLLLQPEATRENWEEIVEEYGDHDDFVQEDGWGRWDVWITELEVDK